jgi:hypothetical protein
VICRTIAGLWFYKGKIKVNAYKGMNVLTFIIYGVGFKNNTIMVENMIKSKKQNKKKEQH